MSLWKAPCDTLSGNIAGSALPTVTCLRVPCQRFGRNVLPGAEAGALLGWLFLESPSVPACKAGAALVPSVLLCFAVLQ